MSQNIPSISTIIATYNRPKFLIRALDCLASQKRKPAEVIVVDDGSGNEVRQAVQDWERQVCPDFSLVYLWQENQGPATARNRGLAASNGNLIQFLDDDDLLGADALEHLSNALVTTDIAIATASYRNWEQGNPVGQLVRPRVMSNVDILRVMIQGAWFIPIHGYLFTRRAIDRIGPWNPVLTSQEDDEFLLRAALAQIPFHPAPAAKVYYCQHDGIRRATPGETGEPDFQSMIQRMHADLAIREFVFEVLTEKNELQSFLIAFSLWRMRLRKRYSSYLAHLEEKSALLDWLNRTDLDECSDIKPQMVDVDGNISANIHEAESG